MSEREGGAPRRWALAVAAVGGVVVAAAVAALVFGVGTDPACACQPEGPDVQIQRTGNDTAVTVTYVAARQPRDLLVTTSASDGSVSLAGTEGDATATGRGARLSAVGAAATFAEDDPATTTSVRVAVDVVYDDGSRVTVVTRTVTL